MKLVSCRVNRRGMEGYDDSHYKLLEWTLQQLTDTSWLWSLRLADEMIHYFRTTEFDRLKLLFHLIGIAGGIGTRRSEIDKFWQVHAEQVGERIKVHFANGQTVELEERSSTMAGYELDEPRKVMVFRPLPPEVGRWDQEQCRTVSCLAADANEKRDVQWRGTSNVIEVTEDFRAFVAGLKVGNHLTCCPYEGTNRAINEAADEAGVPKGFIANVVLQFEPPTPEGVRG